MKLSILTIPLASLVYVFSPCAPSAYSQPLPPPPQLGTWTLYGTNFDSDSGYAPKTYTNTFLVNTGFTNGFFYGKYGAFIDTTNTSPSSLHYNVVESDGTTNLTVPNGTIALWLSPNWKSSTQGGSGPGQTGYLIGAGRWDTNAKTLLSLTVSSDGSTITFSGQTNSATTSFLSSPVSWTSNQAHFICTTYSPSNSALFIDGQFVTNGSGLSPYPDGDALTNGFYVGSDNAGLEQARGVIFGLQTWGSPLDGGEVTNLYLQLTSTNSNNSTNPPTNAVSCTPGSLLFTLNGSWGVTPMLEPDGSIIVIGDPTCSYTSVGGANWSLSPLPGANTDTAGMISDDGTIYISGYMSGLQSISSSGATNWYWLPNGGVGGIGLTSENASLGLDGSIYVCTDAALLAMTPTGSNKWAYKNPYFVTNTTTGVFSYSRTSVGHDGTIYLGGAKPTKLFAINPNGMLKWIANTPVSSGNYASMTSCSIGADGTIYAGTQPIDGSPCHLIAFKPDGSWKWVYTNTVDSRYNSQPTIGPDGTIYVASINFNVSTNDTTLTAFNHDGSIKWARTTFDSTGDYYGGGPTPAIAADGTICFGSGAAWYNGTIADYAEAIVYGLKPSDGSEIWRYDTGGFGAFTAPVIAPDGTVLIINIDQNVLYALCGSAGPACSAWPQFLRNARHTARIVPPNINSTVYTNGNFTMNLSGTNGVICDVCATMDFTNWTNLGTITLTNAGTNFIDAQASNFTRRFYRPLGQ